MQALSQSAQHIYEKREGSGAGSVPLTNRSGSGRPINMRIRIPNNKGFFHAGNTLRSTVIASQRKSDTIRSVDFEAKYSCNQCCGSGMFRIRLCSISDPRQRI
jgi:hypothetical protein